MAVAVNQRLTGSVSAVVGVSTGTVDLDFCLCYQLGAGAVTTFNTYLTATVGTQPLPFNASGTTTALTTAGTYTVGFCARDTSATAISNTDWVNGFVQVTN